MASESKFVRLDGIKSLGDREFSGHGSVFNNTDLGGDVVCPGAFTKSLAEHKSAGTMPAMLWAHDSSRVPGRWLSMHEDSHGLAVHGQFVDTPLGNEVHTLVRSGASVGLSIGFRITESDYDRDGARLIKGCQLFEVSLTPMPMNPRATVARVKDQLGHVRDWEKALHAMGFSRRAATRLAAKTWGEMSRELGGSGIAELEAISADLEERQAIAKLLSAAETVRGF